MNLIIVEAMFNGEETLLLKKGDWQQWSCLNVLHCVTAVLSTDGGEEAVVLFEDGVNVVKQFVRELHGLVLQLES